MMIVEGKQSNTSKIQEIKATAKHIENQEKYFQHTYGSNPNDPKNIVKELDKKVAEKANKDMIKNSTDKNACDQINKSIW